MLGKYWVANVSASYDLWRKWRPLSVLFWTLWLALGLGGFELIKKHHPLIGALIGAAPVLLFFLFSLIVTPALTWARDQEKITPKLEFIEHENNYFPQGESEFLRVTVTNIGAEILHNVRAYMVDIRPRPAVFRGNTHVPLRPMNCFQIEIPGLDLNPGDKAFFDALEPAGDGTIRLNHWIATLPSLFAYVDPLEIDVEVSADKTRHTPKTFLMVTRNGERRLIPKPPNSPSPDSILD
jgi:hypothetical protein